MMTNFLSTLKQALCCLSVVITFNCCATNYQKVELVEEGWRWKRTFKIDIQGTIFDLDTVDQQLQAERENIQEIINATVNNLVKDKNLFQSVLEKNVEARKYFLSLNNNDISIEHLLKKLQLNLDSVESISKAISNQEVVRIIDESAKRLLNRNYVLAGIHYFHKEELYFKKLLDLSSQKINVFVSGSGNELLKVLEKFPELDAYQFIIFDKTYEGFLKGNLEYILSHQSDRIPAHLKMRSKNLQDDLNSYISASKTLNKELSKYNTSTTLIKTKIQELPDLSSLETTKEHQQTFQFLLSDLGTRFQQLNLLQTSFQDMQLLISKYYHSEQLLRLFLYHHLNDYIDHTDKNSCLILHINSTNDICERCAHCLFLESEMSQADTERIRAKVGPKNNPRIDPYGFYEKFNYVKGKSNNNNYLIIASSGTVGEKRGEKHRYLAGHDGQYDQPINPDLFRPLMAFKTLQDKTYILPLDPNLMTIKNENNSNVLYQDIFPNTANVNLN